MTVNKLDYPKCKARKQVNKAGRPDFSGMFTDGTYDIDNFHKVFIEENDPTEYKAAIRLVGSWPLWNRIKRNWPTFAVYVNEWIDELAVKIRSEAVQKILTLQDGDDAKALQAAKFNSEAGWNKRAGAGAPNKRERKRAIAEQAKMASETKEEQKRLEEALNFQLVEGGKGK